MAEQILVAGLGRFGKVLARSLTQAGYDVLAVDCQQEPLIELGDSVGKVVQGNATSIALWQDLPIRGANIAVVAFSSSVEANVMTALVFRKLGIKHVIAKSQSELHTELLRAIGVQSVIEPTKESAVRLAHTAGTRIADYLPVTGEFGVAFLSANGSLKGVNTGKLYEDKKVTVLLIRRGDRVILQPRDREEIKDGDMLLVAGMDHDLRRLPAGVPADGQ